MPPTFYVATLGQLWTKTSPPADPTPEVIHALTAGLVQVATQHPFLAVVILAITIRALANTMHGLIHTGPRDTRQRLFTRAEKQLLLVFAGHRCEHHNWLTGRCKATDRLEADHIHPWSRGGWTNLSNGQILCRRHNRAKLATVPYNRSLRKLAERRRSYYPPGADPTVTRRPPRRPSELRP